MRGNDATDGVPGEGGDDASALDELKADIETAIDNFEPQSPAAYRFEVWDGKIEALPFLDVARDPGEAQIYLDEARRKAEWLKDRLERSNAVGRVKMSVKWLKKQENELEQEEDEEEDGDDSGDIGSIEI